MNGKKAARKKSEKRQREKQIKVRCLSDEFNEIAAHAAQSGLSIPAYLRAVGRKGDPGARSRKQPAADAHLLHQVLAQLSRYGHNWNQVAYKLNTGAAPREVLDKVEAGLRELAEIIALNLEALGKKPHRA